ncbi:MAG TPA: alpha-amylase family glycosyl hydrolase, partial [Steroidobacteraceae bacterium]|nr:alpha-amylase family glycosyl hydrolase [Steroidobacteraceae bacterium]
MSAPRATMRLQFHRGFTFSDARSLSEYFASLGISHVYASPIMTVRTGSLHGYDVIDPTRINPELGGEDELRRLVEELRRYELGL